MNIPEASDRTYCYSTTSDHVLCYECTATSFDPLTLAAVLEVRANVSADITLGEWVPVDERADRNAEDLDYALDDGGTCAGCGLALLDADEVEERGLGHASRGRR